MSSIFLSHSSQDNGIAGHVKVRLEQWGHRSIFLDFDPANGIPGGRDWEKELYAKLRECRALIILCSHASMASRWCFAEITHAKALGKPVLSIKIDEVQVDSILTRDEVIDATVGWESAYQRLEKGLLAAGLDPKDLFDWDHRRSPYPGLPSFQEKDAAIFFGRDKEIREGQALLNQLQQFDGPRLTLMLGASGSGKSSLMRAGLLPRLKRDSRWLVVEPFRPLKAPFDEFATVLTERFSRITQEEKGTPSDVAHVRDQIKWQEHEIEKSVDAFLALIKTLRETSGSREATVLLMIDQCEELLASGANEEGNRFLAFLRAVLDREDSGLMVLATLRSDFLGSFQDHPAMRGLRVKPFAVSQMAVDDFASVIEGPAGIAGLVLGPGLVQAMISDTQTSDALPLLAFTLRELYEGFGQDRLLTLEEYRDKLGRLKGCIARAAEAVLTAKPLSEKEISALRTALLSMVRANDQDQYAKQPVQWNDLHTSSHDVLERFVTARLMISSGDKNGRTLEVAHEALFRAWPRLADWLRDNKSFSIWQQRLNVKREEWERSNRSADLLLRGLPLDEALDWLKKKSDYLSPGERQFVTAGKTRKIKAWVITATVGSLVLLLVGGPIAWLAKERVPIHVAWSIVQARLYLVQIRVPDLMVEIPRGDFRMANVVERLGGRGTVEEQLPVRMVTIAPFKLSMHEVTFEEYDQYVELTGNRRPPDEKWERGRQPAINVSWEEANAYTRWLSSATGQSYRLPTEAEWEYAARSGGQNEIWAGTSDEKQLKDYAVYNAVRTEPVGGKKPNGLGLYDMTGNVWEWVQDCDDKVDEDKCDQRVFRGGSWNDGPGNLRVSFRTVAHAGFRLDTTGFRLAQDIP